MSLFARNAQNKKNANLELKVKVKKYKNATYDIPLEMSESIQVNFSEFELPGNIRLRKKLTHTYTNSEKIGVLTIDKICKTDLLNYQLGLALKYCQAVGKFHILAKTRLDIMNSREPMKSTSGLFCISESYTTKNGAHTGAALGNSTTINSHHDSSSHHRTLRLVYGRIIII